MSAFDENFKKNAAEARRARSEAHKRGLADDFEAKMRSAAPVIARVCRDMAAVLRVARVPVATDDGWSLPDLPSVLSAPPRYTAADRFGKRFGLQLATPSWATLTPDGALLSDRFKSSVRRERTAEREARIRAVHQAIAVSDVNALAGTTLEADFGMTHRLVLDRNTRVLFVCAGVQGARPTVLPFSEYGSRASSALVQAWEHRGR
ncbi:hypothetical protein ACFFQW_33920 [Umezawaea endophytica]|uniref:Uncharacterized protein n=1 Tax=Umezawaea endophytica TaxID=1654476 RepID=A0A9X2VHI9_9PSEU|nr:hypothetical protein [Umezawaea endophytica]MCS7476539.1 hypothetical protein [Umezawaea endophytica]